MSKGETQTSAAADAVGTGGLKSGNIAQIRELLFGQFQREVEGRFARLDDRVDQVKRDADEQIELLREKFDKQIELLDGRLSQRLDKLDALAAEIDRKQDAARAQAVDDLGARVKTAEENLRAELRAESKQAQKALDLLRADFEQAARNLADGKTSRIDLADHLIEIGARLKAAPSLEGIEAQLQGLVAGVDDSDG